MNCVADQSHRMRGIASRQFNQNENKRGDNSEAKNARGVSV